MPGTRFDSSQPAATGSSTHSDARPEFRVAAFGLANKFQRVLEIVFKHARHNQYRFTMAPSRGPGDFDLALVDMTAKGGPEVAQTLKRLPDTRPIITVGRREDPTRACDDLVLQRFALNLLAALNRAVERHLTGPAQRAAASLARTATLLTGHADPEALLGRRPRVLLVDESPSVRKQVSFALMQMGLDSEGVGSAREALDMMAVRRYELAIVEVMLPDSSGLRLTRDIKRDPALVGMPVIVLTRRSSTLDLLRGAMSGCDSYLVKPVSLQALRDTVVRCIRKSLASTARPPAPAPA
jgi:CheY-like chemotaxis protein